jgi:hypothetical protein
MTGRQLLRRPGYELDRDKILACAKHGVAVEINANPWRLDLDSAGPDPGFKCRHAHMAGLLEEDARLSIIGAD